MKVEGGRWKGELGGWTATAESGRQQERLRELGAQLRRDLTVHLPKSVLLPS
jgi:hypothetical protein